MRALPSTTFRIEGVREERVDAICVQATVCDEIHVTRHFEFPKYKLTLNLLSRGRASVPGHAMHDNVLPVDFSCTVGPATNWEVCRSRTVIPRITHLLQENEGTQ
jgi:hypothetical protein